MGDLGGMGDDEDDWHERWEAEVWWPGSVSLSPASGGEGEPESDSRTQIPESKLRLDWLLLAGWTLAPLMLEMSGSLRWCLRQMLSPEPVSSPGSWLSSATVGNWSDTERQDRRNLIFNFFKKLYRLGFLCNLLWWLCWLETHFPVLDDVGVGRLTLLQALQDNVVPLSTHNINILSSQTTTDQIFTTKSARIGIYL